VSLFLVVCCLVLKLTAFFFLLLSFFVSPPPTPLHPTPLRPTSLHPYTSEFKSMSISFRFSVLFAGMVGLHNAEENGLHEACKKETRFQSGEEMGLILPFGSCTIFLHVTFKHDSFQLSRCSTSNHSFQESVFKCVEQVIPDFGWKAAVSSV
jgi:hypothetical protein